MYSQSPPLVPSLRSRNFPSWGRPPASVAEMRAPITYLIPVAGPPPGRLDQWSWLDVAIGRRRRLEDSGGDSLFLANRAAKSFAGRF